MIIHSILAITQVMFVSMWPHNAESAINKNLTELELSINQETQTLNVKDIQINENRNEAIIIYEISDKKSELSS